MQHENIQARQRLRQCFGRDLGHEASVNVCNLSVSRDETQHQNSLWTLLKQAEACCVLSEKTYKCCGWSMSRPLRLIKEPQRVTGQNFRNSAFGPLTFCQVAGLVWLEAAKLKLKS